MPFKNQHPLYVVWIGLRHRCNSPNHPAYYAYGARGITVCERWNSSFQAFLEDMEPRPPGHSIERIDNDGPYSPENCRWATRKEQQRNRRNAVYVMIEGIKYRAIDLSERYGLKTDTIVARAAKGMTFADVITQEKHVFTEGLALGGKISGDKRLARGCISNGHAFKPENMIRHQGGWRTCGICMKIEKRNVAKRRRA